MCFRESGANSGLGRVVTLGDKWLHRGEKQTVGIVFLSGRTAVDSLSKTSTFFLWDHGIIGAAKIASIPSQTARLPPTRLFSISVPLPLP